MRADVRDVGDPSSIGLVDGELSLQVIWRHHGGLATTHAGPTSIARLRAQIKAEWRAQADAEMEARRRASEQADVELARLAQARQQDWTRQHQAAGGLLVTGVGPACAVQEQVAAFVQNLRALAGNTSCELYVLGKAEVRLSYLSEASAPVKDLQFQCVSVGASGTAVGSPVTLTIYDVWQPGQIKEFRIVMPAHPQMASAKWQVLRGAELPSKPESGNPTLKL